MKHVLCSGQGFMLHQDGADKWKNMAEVGFREALFKKFIHQIVTSAFGFFSQRKASSFQYPANLKSQGSYPLGQLLLKKKKREKKKCWQGYGQTATLLCCWWGCKLVQPLWRIIWGFVKRLGIELPCDHPSFAT